MDVIQSYQAFDPAKGMFLPKPQWVKTVKRNGQAIGEHFIAPAGRDSGGIVRYEWSKEYLVLY